MRSYDFKSAKKYIQTHSDHIDTVALGMKEDWFWTAETVYEKERFTKELDKKDMAIGGITSSQWATPVLQVIFKDGTELFKDCFTGDADGQKPDWISLGCLSGPCQDIIDRETSVPKLTA